MIQVSAVHRMTTLAFFPGCFLVSDMIRKTFLIASRSPAWHREKLGVGRALANIELGTAGRRIATCEGPAKGKAKKRTERGGGGQKRQSERARASERREEVRKRSQFQRRMLLSCSLFAHLTSVSFRAVFSTAWAVVHLFVNALNHKLLSAPYLACVQEELSGAPL
eukprot:4007828-Pleurochrysis_carterae.AAC.13